MSLVSLSPLEWMLALTGGLLIGGAASGLMLAFGQVAGVSGLLRGAARGRPEAIAFILGLPAGAWVVSVLGIAHAGEGVLASPLLASPLFASPGRLVLAGLLVGLGAGLANGCTSGHSVCGIARLSPRSLVATVIFISAGALMVLAAGVPGS